MLEQLDDLHALWQTLKTGLERSQIKQIEGIIEAKREAWGTGAAFTQFVADTIANANWKHPPEAAAMQVLQHAATNGMLTDVVELYLEILKAEVTP